MNSAQHPDEQITVFDESGEPVAFVSLADFLDDETKAHLAHYGIAA